MLFIKNLCTDINYFIDNNSIVLRVHKYMVISKFCLDHRGRSFGHVRFRGGRSLRQEFGVVRDFEIVYGITRKVSRYWRDYIELFYFILFYFSRENGNTSAIALNRITRNARYSWLD